MTARQSRRSVADIYELSPMQEAMLFHCTYAPDSRAYFDQFSCRIDGLSRPDDFRESWQTLSDRHAVLRTSFHWQDLPKPMQVVHESVLVPWTFEDWSHLDASVQSEKWQGLLAEDRKIGFALEQAPLFRCKLARLNSDTCLFAWSHHHIILDGWCLSLILSEIFETYNGLGLNQRPAAKTIPRYRDYIVWLQTQDQTLAREFWAGELKGFSSPTELSAISPIRGHRSAESDSRLSAALSEERSTELRSFAARRQLTTNTLVQGAWSILLHRYSGESDVLFGATESGRSADVPGIDRMLGVFINTIPVRLQVDPDSELVPYLKRLQERQARRSRNAFLPLKDIRQSGGLPHGASLFHTNLILMNYPYSAEKSLLNEGLRIRDVEVFENTDLPLTLEITPGLEWQIDLVYDSSTIDSDWIHRIRGHFISLLTEFSEHSDRPIGSLQILTEAERRQFIHEFNDNRVETDWNDTLVHRLEKTFARCPENTVVECEGRAFKAAELNRGANQLARLLLLEVALEPDDRVAIIAQRSERLIETILAVWKCRAAYVPVDPDYPGARVRNVVQRAGAKIVIAEKGQLSAGLRNELEQIAKVVVLDEIRDSKSVQEGSNLGIEVDPGSLAYVIFTSGSTGEPKGAMIEQAGMLNHILAKVHDLDISQQSIVAQTASHCFDISIWQMFAAPLVGGKTIVYPDHVVLEPDRLIDRSEVDGITIMELVPSHLSAVLDSAEDRERVFSGLRWIEVTGEPVSKALMRRWFEMFPEIPVANAYGPTECSDNVTHLAMHGVPEGSSVPVGHPLRNINIYVTDSRMNLCPVGVKGEICASGVGVGRGYLNDQVLTAGSFTEDPFIDSKGVRLYKTGDLGCYLPDGNLVLFGRKDQQVKLRGFRIELGEIEAALAMLDGVREAAVVDRRDDGKEPYLCAYFTLRNGKRANARSLARDLAQVLPDYMLPAAFVEMEALPITVNGKVDRKALPAPSLVQMPSVADYVAPRSDVHRTLAEVWSATLNVPSPGIHDNFFSLGGDSILSMQVVSRARRAGLKVAMTDVFRYPTIAELALRTSKIEPGTGYGTAHTAKPSAQAPLTPIQLYFLEKTKIEPHHYNQSVLVEMADGIDPALLEAALHVVVEIHDSLRLRFPIVGGVPQQRLSASGAGFLFIVRDLAEVPERDRNAAIHPVAEDLQRSLNLTDGPLIASALFTKGDRGASLLLVVHHLCIDAMSWRILLEDLAGVYEQLARGARVEEIRRPETTASYQEWSNRLADYARSEIGATEQQYWLNLAGSAVPAIPVDRASTLEANTVDSGGEVWVQLDEARTNLLLRDAPQAYNTQIDDILLTALALAVSDWSGIDKIMIDVETHGREALFDDLDISRTTGWFTALFPVVLNVKKDAGDLGANLKSIKEQSRRIPKSGLGYGLLRYYSADERVRLELSWMRPSQILFNYLGQTDRALGSGSGWKADIESVGPARSGRQLRDYLLEINGLVADGQVKLSFSYSKNFHDRATVERLSGSFKRHLLALIDHCCHPAAGGFTPSDVPLASLNQESLDVLFDALKITRGVNPRSDVVDVYRLSPVQQGMLFHTLYRPESSTYFNQLTCVIEGPLNPAAFKEAWSKTIEHHASLRTSFHWEGLEGPIQVVHRATPAQWMDDDGDRIAPEASDRQWQEYLEQDRNRRFDLARPPLMRFGLVRTHSGSHRFNWSYHHLLLDGWSLAIILNDMLVAYQSILRSEPVQLAVNRQFRENIEWLSRADLAAAEAYWREKLKGFTVATPLMLGAPELEGGQCAGEYAEEEVSLSPDLTARLNEIGRECGITLNTIAQGVWALLLSRYSGEPEVVFGSIVSGRPPELEGADKMVGVFINTLPLRVQIDRSRARNDWLEALQIDQAEREQYAYSSLIDIQRWSEIPAGSPLFESILIFENYPIEDSLLQGAGGLSITQVHAHDPNNYPVTLVVTPARQAGPDVVISLKVMYDDGRFDRATIQRLIGHYECLMDNLARSPEPFIGDADILTEAERTQTLCDWRSAEVPLPNYATFLDLFEDNADKFAGRCAVQMEGLALSYRELDDWADRLAARLMFSRTVSRGDRIAVLMHRSPAMVAGILAIWKCRAAYVPIDPDYPFERIKTVLEDSGSVLVIAETDDVAGRCFEAGLDIHVVMVGETEPGPGSPKSELDSMTAIAHVTGGDTARLSPTPDDAAYVIYTSGSTGRPKGAIIEHRGVLNHLLAMMSELELGPDSIVAQTASHCFDISMWQFFAALLAGGRSSIYPDRTVVNPAALVDLIEQDHVEVVQFVPSYLAVFLDELELRNDGLIFSRLKWLVTIGETLKPAYVRRWFDLFKHVKLMNAYGPTEASDSVTHHVMDRPPSSPGIPIGRPIQNIHIYVLDPQMNLCPIGIKGEICIGGVGVGRGYLGDPERTRDSFASDRFSGEPGARLYKTGDIGCFGPDGNLFFFGRKDHQVKIRGHRLELGEVESALAGIAGVRSCAVIGRERQGQTTLCAFVWLRDDSRLQSSDLKVALSERLPAYMVPDAIRILPDLPLNSSGKIDRKRLPGIEDSDLNTIKSPSPITKTQHDVADIWKDVLGAEHVGIDDHFVELGGHSLNAIQIVSRIRNQLGRDVSFADLFQFNTVRRLAARIEELAAGIETGIPAVASSDDYETSRAQKRIWLASINPGSSPAYNMHSALALDGAVDGVVLRRAIKLLMDRHESLRTVFFSKHGDLRQRILPALPIEEVFEEVDLRGTTNPEEDARLLAAGRAEAPFAIDRGPLFKACLFRTAESRCLLTLTMHHIIADAWSLQIIFRELVDFYSSCHERKVHAKPSLSTQYKEYAAWHNQWLESAEAGSAFEFWLTHLTNAPRCVSLPSDFGPKALTTYQGDSVRFTIDSSLVFALRRAAQFHGTSLYGVLLSCIYALVFRYTNQEDIVIGTQSSGRGNAQLEPQVGCFVNTLALRGSITGSDRAADVIQRVGGILSEALRHQMYPFDKVVQGLKRSQVLPSSPLFAIQVDYAPELASENNSIASFSARELIERRRTTKHPISFLIEESSSIEKSSLIEESRAADESGANRLTVEIVYSTELYTRQSILVLSDRLLSILRAFSEDDSPSIESIDLSAGPNRAKNAGASRRVKVELNIAD